MNVSTVVPVSRNAPITPYMKAVPNGVFSDGTKLSGMVHGKNSGIDTDADAPQPALSMDVYYIATDKCTECVGFFDEPQCAAVCPVDCCIKDEDNVETPEELLEKKKYLHGE